MMPTSGRNRRPPRRRWLERPAGWAAAGGFGGPGGSGDALTWGRSCGERSRGGLRAGLVGGLEDPLHLAVDVGRQRIGVRQRQKTLHFGARRLDLVVPL